MPWTLRKTAQRAGGDVAALPLIDEHCLRVVREVDVAGTWWSHDPISYEGRLSSVGVMDNMVRI